MGTRMTGIGSRLLIIASAILGGCEVANAQQANIPASIRAEHEELLADLNHATVGPGRVGDAARALTAVLLPHFTREEQIALPPLGLLRALTQRGATLDARITAILVMTDSLTIELPAMLRDHAVIRVAVDRLAQVAREEMRPEQVSLAERLRLHALTEEEVLYPAALLVGKYIHLWFGSVSNERTERR